MKDMEGTKKHAPDKVVFVSNRRIINREAIQNKIKKKYGWTLTIYDQEFLRLHLEAPKNHRFRKNYLGIDYNQDVFTPIDVETKERPLTSAEYGGGAYYREDSLHDEIFSLLEKNGRALVLGGPGSGKTTLLRAVGLEFQKKAPRNSAFYFSAKGNNANEWLNAIQRYDDEYSLFIIDNCHRVIETVNDFIAKLPVVEKAWILLAGRDIDEDTTGTDEESFISSLKYVTKKLTVNDEQIKGILACIVKRKRLEGKEVGHIEKIAEKCQGDLQILNFYANAWADDSTGKTLEEIDEEKMLDNYYRHHLQTVDSKNSRKCLLALLRLAALYQFEIPAQENCIDNSGLLSPLRETGLVIRETKRIGDDSNYTFLSYHHSTPASYALRAASSKGIVSSTQAYTLETIEEYFGEKPTNFFEVFKLLYRNGGEKTQKLLFQRGRVFPLCEEILNESPSDKLKYQLAGIANFLYGVWRWEEKADKGKALELSQLVQNKFTPEAIAAFANDVPFSTLVYFIVFFGKINPAFVKSLWHKLPFSVLGERSRDSGLAVIERFLRLSRQAEVSNENILSFCDGLDFKEFGSLRQWNMLIHNVVNYEVDFLKECIVSTFASIPIKKYEKFLL
ncbi:MAG: hypothetical protein HZA01_02270 [Nitrospinae bacterium]|nr:hypothetical protein [Nitrospinota bacterium]